MNRVSPAMGAVTRDLSTSRLITSRTSAFGTSSSEHTASTASSSQPPTKTDRRCEEALLVIEEQVVAPVHDGTERLLAG